MENLSCWAITLFVSTILYSINYNKSIEGCSYHFRLNFCLPFCLPNEHLFHTFFYHFYFPKTKKNRWNLMISTVCVAPQEGLEPTTLRLTAECSAIELLRHGEDYSSLLESGGDLLFRAVSSQVPSALKGLTSVFGMGTGGTPSPLPPETVSLFGGWGRWCFTHSYLPKVPVFPLGVSLSFGVPFGLSPATELLTQFRPHLCVKSNACYASSCFRIFRARCHTLTTAQVKDDCSFLTFPCSLRPSSQSRWNQALDLLVSSSSIRYRTSTDDLSPGSLPGVLLPWRNGNLILEVGFTLRCFQRLSHPHFASLLCRWHDNSCTSGASIPVLSY